MNTSHGAVAPFSASSVCSSPDMTGPPSQDLHQRHSFRHQAPVLPCLGAALHQQHSFQHLPPRLSSSALDPAMGINGPTSSCSRRFKVEFQWLRRMQGRRAQLSIARKCRTYTWMLIICLCYQWYAWAPNCWPSDTFSSWNFWLLTLFGLTSPATDQPRVQAVGHHATHVFHQAKASFGNNSTSRPSLTSGLVMCSCR